MALLQISNPLHWPAYIPATERIMRQVNPQFQLNMQEKEALAFIEDELERTPQVTSAVLSCDAANINSTTPTHYLSKNTGASLRVMIEDARYYLCCDRWQSLAHNIYALHLGLRYYRQLSEWGLGTMSFLMGGAREGGVAAAKTSHHESRRDNAALMEWQHVLGLGPTATLEDANALYRLRAKAIGENNQEELRTLNIAVQQARESLG